MNDSANLPNMNLFKILWQGGPVRPSIRLNQIKPQTQDQRLIVVIDRKKEDDLAHFEFDNGKDQLLAESLSNAITTPQPLGQFIFVTAWLK